MCNKKKPKESLFVEQYKNEKELTTFRNQNQEQKREIIKLQEEISKLEQDNENKLIQQSKEFGNLIQKIKEEQTIEKHSNSSEQIKRWEEIASSKVKEAQHCKGEIKKNRDVIRKLRIDIINSSIIPMLANIQNKQLPEETRYGYNSTSKSFNINTSKNTYIILDTNVFFPPKKPINNFTDEHLINLLNRIQNNQKSLIPIITKEIRKELKKKTIEFADNLNDVNTSEEEQIWLDIYPAIRIKQFLINCFYEPSQNQKFQLSTEEHLKTIKRPGILGENEIKELDKTDGGEFDRNHAAKTKALDAILVSEDGGLLSLRNNSNIKLNTYPLYQKDVMKNYNKPINDILKERGYK